MDMSDAWTLHTPVARLITLQELSQTSESEPDGAPSSVNKLKREARTHFDAVALHITNERWRERWKSMCVSQVENVLDGLERDDEDEKMTDEEREKEEKKIHHQQFGYVDVPQQSPIRRSPSSF